MKNEILLQEGADLLNVEEIIKEQVGNNNLLVYMKGTSMMPMCGFSAQVIEIFNRLGVSYTTFNVLNSFEIREGIKQYSNWPTVPQVYYKQEFLGGCDIITEMYQNGELSKTLGL